MIVGWGGVVGGERKWEDYVMIEDLLGRIVEIGGVEE